MLRTSRPGTIDGVTVPVTVSMTDRFSNPVPDGTTANFQTTLGGIQASCQTGSDHVGLRRVRGQLGQQGALFGQRQSRSRRPATSIRNPAYCPGIG